MRFSRDELQRLGRLAWLLDSAFVLPGTRFRFGIDALLGLIPGLGDALGVAISGYIIREAARAGVPASVLLRMALNVAVEGIVGIVPIAGDVFDAAWKANQRNVALLEAHADDPKRTTRRSMALVALVLTALVLFFLAMSVVGFLVARAIWHAIAG